MPAIAAPPFSINPGGIPASIAIPSYAGVSVPQVTGLHAELVVSSTSGGSSLQGAQNYIQGSGNGPAGLLSTAAVIHQFPQTVPDPLTIPTHPNQVSVVVDPRGGISVPTGEVPITQPTHDHIWSHQWQTPPPHMSRPTWMNDSLSPSYYSTPSPTYNSQPLVSSISNNHWTRINSDNPRPSQSTHVGLMTHSRQSSSPSSLNSPVSLPFLSPMPPGSMESSDDDLSNSSSPFQWPHPAPLSIIETLRTGSSDEQSPPSSTNQSNSALQTLADAAALLSSSPRSDEGSYDETDESSRHSFIPESDSDDLYIPTVLAPSAPPLQSNRLVSSHHGNMLTGAGRSYPLPPGLGNYHRQSEELPVFVPVIHPTIDENAMFAPQEGGLILPVQQPLAEVPSMIHVTQGGHTIMPVPDPWPAIVEPPYIHSHQLLSRANGGGFWEEVLVS